MIGTPNRKIAPVAASLAILASVPLAANAADVPEYMKIITLNETAPPPKEKIAFKNLYQLNEAMMPLYDSRIALFKQHMRERIPVILALFSGDGGRFILYPPGKDPIEAPPPRPIYKMAKAVGHCAMVTYNVVSPFCTTSDKDPRWIADMKAYRTRVQIAIDAIDDLPDTKPEEKELLKDTLKNHVLAFMDQCLSKGSFTYDDVIAYARGVKPNLAKLIGVASSEQVSHWWTVMEEWKKMLGPDWDKAYGLSNSIYVARQNNILFTLLANFFGEKAINDRLLLAETTDFTTTPDDMLDLLVRIVSDRALGESFYKNYMMMDYELLGSGGRNAIQKEAEKRGQKALLPPLVPFNSNQWPMRTDTKFGSGPTTLEEIK
jgi:hypothetical protein